MNSIKILLTISLAVILVACGNSNQSENQPAEEFSFAGETITVVIGLDASAGGTTLGRLFAKHLETTLPGNPTVIVNNMPGASTLNAHLHVLLKAPKDGTTVYYGPRSSLGELLQLPGFSFKYSEFTPLGGVQVAGLVVYTRTDAFAEGIRGPEDIVGKGRLNFGGMPAEHGRMIISTMALDLIGANYKYIGGYPSSGNIRAAIISGEVDTATDAAHAYLNQVVPVLVDEGQALPMFSMPLLDAEGGMVQNHLVPDIPALHQLYQTLNGEPPSGVLWDSIATLLELDQTMQHVFMGPPGMDSAAAEAFRVGVEKALTSEEYFEEAERILSYAPGYVSHQRQAEILGATDNVSREVVTYIESHIEKNNDY